MCKPILWTKHRRKNEPSWSERFPSSIWVEHCRRGALGSSSSKDACWVEKRVKVVLICSMAGPLAVSYLLTWNFISVSMKLQNLKLYSILHLVPASDSSWARRHPHSKMDVSRRILLWRPGCYICYKIDKLKKCLSRFIVGIFYSIEKNVFKVDVSLMCRPI